MTKSGFCLGLKFDFLHLHITGSCKKVASENPASIKYPGYVITIQKVYG